MVTCLFRRSTMMTCLAAIAAAGWSAPAVAEVIGATDHGFEIRHRVNLVAEPNAAMAAFAELSRWWDPKYTYSGDSQNLSLALRAGSCLCEIASGGGEIEHMRVAYIVPDERIVLTGSLGQLLHEATTGVMDVQFKPTGGGSEATLSYKVVGFPTGGAQLVAPKVDQMLSSQLKRYRAYVPTRPRNR